MKRRISSLFLACAILLYAAPAAYAQNAQPAADSGETAPALSAAPQSEAEGYADSGDAASPAVDSGGPSQQQAAAAGEADDGCNTAEELYEFLSANAGGSITLTGDILWDNSDGLGYITRAAVVEMGRYKIEIPGDNAMQIAGPVTFRGEGAALFEVKGGLNLSYGVQALSSGEGAVAIDIGEGGSAQLIYCRVEAAGESSTAIRSVPSVQGGAVTIQLCSISGARAAIEAPSVTLDGTAAFPEPDGAAVVKRVPVIDRSMRLYGISLSDSDSEERYREAIYGLGLWNFAFIDPDSGNVIGLALPSEWSGVPKYPAAAGSYTLTLEPSALPEWFPVEIPGFSIPLHIAGGGAPHITVTFAGTGFGFVDMALTNAQEFDGAERLTLYYSTDAGESWRNVEEDFSGAFVGTDAFFVEPLEPETNYWFYAEAAIGADTVSSNILYYPNFVNDMDVDFSYGGGDPDEDDFGDQGEQAPSGPIIPAPEAGGGSDDSSGGSDDGSGGRETEAEPTPEPAPQAPAAPYPASEPIPEPTPVAAAATLPQPAAAPAPAPTPTEPDGPARQAPPQPAPKPAGKAADGESVAASQPDKAAAANAKGEAQPPEAARPGGLRWAAWIAALTLACGGAAFALWRRRKEGRP